MKTTSVFSLVAILVIGSVANGATVWNPIANGIEPPETGDWGNEDNWTNFLPEDIEEKAVFNVADAAEAVVSDEQLATQWVQGDNGPGGVIRVVDGGHLMQIEDNDWAAVGYNNTAHMIVEAGGRVDFSGHMWVGYTPEGEGIVDINGGTVTAGGMFGLGWNGGDGFVNVNDGGVLTLSNIHADGERSILQNSLLNISGTGVVTIDGDHTTDIEMYAANGFIAGNGVPGDVNILFENEITSILAALPADPCDLNEDGVCDYDDLETLTTPEDKLTYLTTAAPDGLGTVLGDVNLDFKFNSDDLISVFASGKYDTGADARYDEGDGDFDGNFDSDDLLEFFAAGNYDAAGATAAVPEPSSVLLSALAAFGLLVYRRRQ